MLNSKSYSVLMCFCASVLLKMNKSFASLSELVDEEDLKSSASRCSGSSPEGGTKNKLRCKKLKIEKPPRGYWRKKETGNL